MAQQRQPNDTPRDESALPFDFQALAQPILNHTWLLLGTAAVVSVLVVFWTIRQPKIYEAMCSLEYDPSPSRPLSGDVEDIEEDASSFWATKEFYKTQNRIITSRTIGERVVRRLGLNKNAGFMDIPQEDRGSWRGESVEEAAHVLQTRLTVEQQSDSRIVEVRVRDRSAQRAALIANTIAEVYIDKTLEDRLGTTVSALEWLSTQLDDLRQDLGEAEITLHEFKQEHNILSVSLQDRQNIVAGTIEQMNQSLTHARTRRIELGARLEQLRLSNAADPMEVNATLVTSDPGVSSLRTRYREKVAERGALATRYGDNHPAIRGIDAELESIRSELRHAIDGLIASVDADLREAQSTETGLRGALEQANQDGLELNLREIEYTRLNRERENKANLYKVLLERTAETNLSKLVRVAHARLLDRALVPTEHVAPRLGINVALGLIGGLVLGFIFAVIRTRVDRTIRSAEDAEALGLTILGVLPKIDDKRGVGRQATYGRKRKARLRPVEQLSKDLIVHNEPRSAVAECARAIRTNVTFMSPDNPVRSLVVTSPRPQEGKTTVAVSLAITMAQSGKRVLVADTDLRRPRLHRVFGCSSEVGITNVLIGDTSLADAVQHTAIPGLDTLPCGPIPPNPSELLHTTKFRLLVHEALSKYDFVLFDSPPLGAVTDAAIVAPQLSGAIVVLRAGSTTRDALQSALRQLHDVGANILGGVLNDLDPSDRTYRGSGYYYYYHSDTYTADDDHREAAPAAE